ncbi:MAG: regulatory domain of subtilisin-like proprotein convertase [Ignavibacteria bacterium]|nr:regulatory domain of subtilisin-like proprotein convertase [Ignavibacteria bacterium]
MKIIINLTHPLIPSQEGNWRHIIFIVIFAINILYANIASAQPFKDINPFTQHQQGLITLPLFADMNSDGKLDIIANREIYRNDGKGGFDFYLIYPISHTIYYQSLHNFIVADFNSDGYLDILACFKAAYDNKFKTILYLNENRDSTSFIDKYAMFRAVDSSFTGVAEYGMPKNLAAVDIDNDGDLDIVLTGDAGASGGNEYTPTLKIYRNDNGKFVENGDKFEGFRRGSVSTFDYDNDGDLDFIITGNRTEGFASNVNSKIFRNDNGKFTETKIPLLELDESMVATGDYDQDGLPDILLSGRDPFVPQTRIYHNDGNGTFSALNNNLRGYYWGDVLWGDFNSDGALDFFAGGENMKDSCLLYLNNNNSFVVADSVKNGRLACLSAGDYNEDGKLDLLMAAFNLMVLPGVEYFTTYQNLNAKSNTAPSMPTGLKSIVNSKNVTLSWDTSTDGETKSSGLTYNIRIGTSPNGVDICPPMSIVPSGKRLVSAFGNVVQHKSWIIKGLPDGKYYWSVQSIDNSYIGSPFQTEQSFIIGKPVEEDSIKIVYPNGGEFLTVGSNVEIQWKGIYSKDSVLLEYSTDNGTNWSVIKNNAYNKKYSWTVPNTPSTKCLARVTAVVARTPLTTVTDLSDAVWTIKPNDPNLAFASLAVDLGTVKTGEVINVSVRLKNQQNLAQSGATRFETTLSFNGNVLYPAGSTPMGDLKGDTREIKLSLPTTLITGDVLTTLSFEGLLGNAAGTQMQLSNTTATGGNVMISEQSGYVAISNICKDKATRLITAGNHLNTSFVSPNPAYNDLNISFDIALKTNVWIVMEDITGRTVYMKEIGTIESGKHDIKIDLQTFTSGMYYLKTNYDGNTEVAPVLIIK